MLKAKVNKNSFYEIKGLTIKPLSNRFSLLIIIILSIFLYANTFTHEFAYDDQSVISKNSYVKDGIGGIKNILTEGSWDGFRAEENIKIYRPFQLLAFAIQYEFFELNPTPYHILHVLFYALLNALIFLLLKEFWKNKYPYLPLLIVLLFTTHPVHTEVVANLKGSADLFGMLNAIAAFLFLFYFLNRKKISYLILASLFYFLSLISKEIAVTYIGVFPLAMYFFTDLKLKTIIKNTLPFIGVVIGYLIIRSIVFNGSNAMSMSITYLDNIILLADTFSQEAGTRLYGLGKNLQLLFYPSPLRSSYLYDDIPILEASNFIAISSLFAYILLIYISIFYLRTKSILVFGIIYYLLTISLFSNTYVMMPSIVSERWLLIPSLGFCIVVGTLVYKAFYSTPNLFKFLKINSSVLLMLFMVIFLFSFKTIERNFDWKNSATLFAADIKTCPNNQIVLRAHGEQLINSNDPQKIKESIFFLEKAIVLAPTRYSTVHNLGTAYYLSGDFENAITVFKGIAKDAPQKYDSVFALAIVYNAAKKHKKALEVLFTLKDVIGYKDTPSFKKQLYISYTGLGNLEEAANDPQKIKDVIFYLEKARILEPTIYSFIHNLGKAYYMIGDLDNAVAVFESIAKDAPQKYDSIYALAIVYNTAKKYKEALNVLLSLKNIDGYKDTASYNKQLYNAYIGLGQLEEAAKYVAK